MNPADDVVANGPAAPRGAVRGEVWTLIALGVIVGLACRGETPELAVAEWLNVLLLPLNAWLVYAIARTWIGDAARWAAAWWS